MSTTLEQEPIALQASDVTGQKQVKVAGVSRDATVGELVHELVPKMGLSESDAEGRPLAYHVLLEREGRHLHAAERVGDVLQPEDKIVLQPNIMAG